MAVYVSRFQALASHVADLGVDGLRRAMAEQLRTLVGLATGRPVAIPPPEVRYVDVTDREVRYVDVTDDEPLRTGRDLSDPVLVYRVEAHADE